MCTINTAAVVDSIVDKINRAPLDFNPTAHFFIENVLPNYLYPKLLSLLPPESSLHPIQHKDAITDDGRITRFLLDITSDTIQRFDDERRVFWGHMIDIYAAEDIKRAILSKFRSELAIRFGKDVPEVVSVPIFYRDMPGYKISVHPDSEDKVATFQFYLPEDLTQRHMGTAFHKRHGNKFVKIKKIPFVPNSAYAFVRTDESWHSVDQVARNELPRDSLALTLYLHGKAFSSR